MRNSFFIAIYLVALGIIVLIQAMRIKQLNDKIKQGDRLKKEIYELGDQISLIDNKQDVYDFILNTAINVIRKGNKGVIIIQEDDGLFYYKAFRGVNESICNNAIRKEDLKLYQYNGCKDIAILTEVSSDEKKKSVLSSPINYDGKLIGVISLDLTDNSIQFNEEDIRTMRYIRHELELVIKNFLIQDRLKHIATHDELTNLCNRRCFDQLFEKEIENIKNRRVETHLAIIDLDDFKKINDNYGHTMGDKALMRMAHAMNRCLSKNDIYARMSGDEFVILFREISYEEAEKKLLDIRDNLKIMKDEINVDFTYGLVTINPNGKLEKDEILSAADRKMYEAKKIKNVGR